MTLSSKFFESGASFYVKKLLINTFLPVIYQPSNISIVTGLSAVLKPVYRASEYKLWDTFPGVADGVGGWRNYGIDPAVFSTALMENCKRLIEQGLLDNPTPVNIMTAGYHDISQNKEPLFGEH